MPSSLFRRKEIAWRFLPFSLVSFFLSITDTRGCRISSAAGTGRSRSLAASERKQPSQRLKSEELSLFFLHFCPPLFSLSFFPPTLSLPPLARTSFLRGTRPSLPLPPSSLRADCDNTSRGSRSTGRERESGAPRPLQGAESITNFFFLSFFFFFFTFARMVVVHSCGVLAIAAWRGEQYMLLRLAGGSGGGGGAAWDTPPPAPASMMSSGPAFANKPPSTTTTTLPSAIGVAPAGSPEAAVLKRAAAEATQVATGVELLEFVSDEFIDVRIRFRFFFSLNGRGCDVASIASVEPFFLRSTGLAKSVSDTCSGPSFFPFFISRALPLSSLSLSLTCVVP